MQGNLGAIDIGILASLLLRGDGDGHILSAQVPHSGAIYGCRPFYSRLGGRLGRDEHLYQQHLIYCHARQGLRYQLASYHFLALHFPCGMAGLQVRRALLSKNTADLCLCFFRGQARALGASVCGVIVFAVYARARCGNSLPGRSAIQHVRSLEHRLL